MSLIKSSRTYKLFISFDELGINLSVERLMDIVNLLKRLKEQDYVLNHDEKTGRSLKVVNLLTKKGATYVEREILKICGITK